MKMLCTTSPNFIPDFLKIRPEVIKLFLCSTQRSMKFQLLLTLKMLKNKDISCYVVFIMLMNVKMPTVVGILTFTSMINFMLSSVEQKKVL